MEIAHEFGVDRKTFRSMLAKFHIDLPNGLISPADQIRIYEKLGKPGLTKPYGG